jgi:signal recognition particle subunit SRP54
MQKMGGMGALMGMMPGMKKAKQAMARGHGRQGAGAHGRDHQLDDAKERAKPELLNAKRKIRIANGSGTRCRTSTSC